MKNLQIFAVLGIILLQKKDKLMIVRIVGGLGNQLFQYAIGRSCCELNHQKLYLDVDCNSGITQRNFELDKLNISNYQRVSYLCSNKYKFIRRIHKPNTRINSFSIFKYGKEYEDFVYQDVSKNTYLDGYWQNELYFKNIKNILTSEFTHKETFNGSIQALLNDIKKDNSVGVHVRRGDYLSIDLYEVLSYEYFYNSINMINKRIENAQFYVFSDDIEWCKNAFYHIDNIRFVEGNSSIEDFELLKNCKHKIISNSTFSWWAAWLNAGNDSIKIAPDKWYKDYKKNQNCKSALLDDFLVI